MKRLNWPFKSNKSKFDNFLEKIYKFFSSYNIIVVIHNQFIKNKKMVKIDMPMILSMWYIIFNIQKSDINDKEITTYINKYV